MIVVRSAPCGCKWYEDGTSYKCLSHRPLTYTEEREWLRRLDTGEPGQVTE